MAIERLLTVTDVAGWLQVKPGTIYQWVHEGYIPVTKLGALVRFDQAVLNAWLRNRAIAGRKQRRINVDIS